MKEYYERFGNLELLKMQFGLKGTSLKQVEMKEVIQKILVERGFNLVPQVELVDEKERILDVFTFDTYLGGYTSSKLGGVFFSLDPKEVEKFGFRYQNRY